MTEPYVLTREAGDSVPGGMPGVQHLLKAGVATGATFTLLQSAWPPHFAANPHVHAEEDELFYVLSGRITVRCGSSVWKLEAGDMAFCPRGIMHQPSSDSGESATALVLTSRPGLEQYFAEVAERLGDLRGGPGSLDVVNQIGAKYGLQCYAPDAFEKLT